MQLESHAQHAIPVSLSNYIIPCSTDVSALLVVRNPCWLRPRLWPYSHHSLVERCRLRQHPEYANAGLIGATWACISGRRGLVSRWCAGSTTEKYPARGYQPRNETESMRKKRAVLLKRLVYFTKRFCVWGFRPLGHLIGFCLLRIHLVCLLQSNVRHATQHFLSACR